jgi:hypothetical protein
VKPRLIRLDPTEQTAEPQRPHFVEVLLEIGERIVRTFISPLGKKGAPMRPIHEPPTLGELIDAAEANPEGGRTEESGRLHPVEQTAIHPWARRFRRKKT